MSRKKVHCAIIGTGSWAVSVHLPAIQKHPQAELLAVQKRSLETAVAIAEKYGIPHACSTLDEVLAIRELDAVIIGSTPNMHYAQVKAALERGLHVLVEKPMTFTRAEAEELVTLADRKRLHFLISCPWHYTAHSVETRRLIRSGGLGRIRMISMLMTNFSGGLYRGETLSDMIARREVIKDYTEKPPDPQPGSYSDPSIAGGGQIYCQISHVAAWLSFATGLEPAEVFARFDYNGLVVDMHDVLNLKMENGTLVSIASSGAPMPSERTFEVRIFGEKGMIFLDLWKGTAAFHDDKGAVCVWPPLEEVYPSAAPAVNLVDTVLGRTENGSPARIGLSAMKVIEAACRSAECGENIRI